MQVAPAAATCLPPTAACSPRLPAQIQRRNLAPALEWVREHEAALRGPDGGPGPFEFSTHRLAFLTLLKEQGERGGALLCCCAFAAGADGFAYGACVVAWSVMA